MDKKKKRIIGSGDKIYKNLSDWTFKGNVYKNFDSHINKSVPLYFETHDLYLKLSDFFLQEKSKIVDIGCSTGTFLFKVFERHKKNHKKLIFVGIDNTKEMIRHCFWFNRDFIDSKVNNH